MAKTLLTLLIMCFCLPSSAERVEEDEKIKIEVIEKDEDDKVKSLSVPLSATMEGTQLTVTALVTIEELTITIVGDGGMVETRTVSMNAGQTEVFSLVGYSDGMYSIAFTNSWGMDLYGVFCIGD